VTNFDVRGYPSNIKIIQLKISPLRTSYSSSDLIVKF
jgi:hypothetical protein